MNKRWMTWSVLGALATAGLGFAGARALATGAPQLSPLTYGGVLTDKDGKAYPSVQEVVLKFYDKVDATAAKCVAPAALAEAGTGRFSVVLPGECAQAVRDSPDLWSEATVGGGKTVLPRVHVGAVPYALEADSAKVAGSAGAASGALQQEIAALQAKVDAVGGGGGGIGVYDGAGVYLGKLITAFQMGNDYDLRLHIWTSTGYNVTLTQNGKPVPASIYFSAKNCTGDGYIDGYVGLAGKGFLQAKLMAYSAVQNSWLAALPQAPTKYTAIEATLALDKASVESASGLCNNSPTSYGSKLGLFKATKVTLAETGLPASIAPGLYVKPL